MGTVTDTPTWETCPVPDWLKDLRPGHSVKVTITATLEDAQPGRLFTMGPAGEGPVGVILEIHYGDRHDMVFVDEKYVDVKPYHPGTG